MMLSYLVLVTHFVIIAFNVVGLILIPLGAHYGWSFVSRRGWRLIHALSWAVVALQALAGRACFLTDLQFQLAGGEGDTDPLIARIVNAVIYWPIPLWMFAVIYAAIFAIVLALLWIVPIRPVSGR